MSSSNTSLNGYEFGRSPRTQTPFWGGSSEGAAIDDSGVYSDKTWSSQKINNELTSKADSDDVYTKTQVDTLLESKAAVTAVYNKSQTYSKDEVDDLISGVTPTIDAYTKSETNALLADKANVADVYTKAQVDNLIPDVSGLATKSELNSGLADKADKSDTYTKAQVDALISGATPAPVDTYTKSETNALLADKANAADVYTKTQVDNLIPDVSGLATKTELNNGLADKADVSELADYAKVTSVYTKTQTYTKSEVDALIEGATPAPVDAYTKAQTDALLADKADVAELANYAKVTSVYTKGETYTKAEVEECIDFYLSYYYDKSQINGMLADKANSSDVYTKTQVDNLISQAGGGAEIDDNVTTLNKTWSSNKIDTTINSALGDVNLNIASSLMGFTDAHGLFRYTTNYGSDVALEDGEIYDVTGDILISINNELVYQGALKDVPYNDLTGSSQQNIGGTVGYKWKEWVVTRSSAIESYSEIPIKVAFIGQVAANNKYNPYIHIIYPSYIYQQGFAITFECHATNYTKVAPEPSGGGGLQEYAYTISSPSSTTISTAITAALADAITNVGIDNMEKLRKIVAKTEFSFGSTPHVRECIYDVKYLNISKGGGNFDDIDICAAGGENYYSAGDSIKTTKLIASRYTGVLNTVEQSGANPVVTSTDWSSTNVGDQMSPWYHNSSGVSDLAYKLVFVYG